MARPSTIVNPERPLPPESAFLLAKTESEELLRHFGFRETPFGVTPDPEFLFWSEMHKSAFHGIVQSIESNLGFSVLIGDPGTGKTTLLFELLTQYQARARTAFIFQTQCRPNDLLRYIAAEFELPCTRRDEVLLHQELKAMLIGEARAGRKVIIVVDEAQNLQPPALEAIRLLCDFQTPPSKLLHVILAGSSRLRETLMLPDLSQLAQRITTIYRLEPLTELEIKEYVKFRLGVAGAEQPAELFSSEALVELAFQSGGVPRLVNAICYRALVRGYHCREQTISGDKIKEAARDIDLAELHRNGSGDFLEAAAARVSPISDGNYEAKRHAEKRTPDTYIPETKLLWNDLPNRFADTVRVPADHATKSSNPADLNARGARFAQGARLKMRMKAQQRRIKAGPARIPGLPALNIASWRCPLSIVLIAGFILLALSSWVAWDDLHARSQAYGEPSREIKQAPPKSLNTPGSSSPATTQKPVSGVGANAVTAPLATPERGENGVTSQHGVPVVEMASDSQLRSRIDTQSLNSAAPAPPSSVDIVSTAPNRTSVPIVDLHPALPRLEGNDDAGGSSAQRVTAPRLTKTVQPEYPDKAKQYHIEGEVLLEIEINQNGQVEKVRPLSGHPILIQAAELAVQQWQYMPSTRDNVPVPATTQVRVHFTLNPEGGK